MLGCRIDEVHMLVGAGSVSRAGGSGLDISNLLKPPLARGELQCIGATTLDDHRKYIERDAALERRFQPVLVAEPSQAQALEILHGLQVCQAPSVPLESCTAGMAAHKNHIFLPAYIWSVHVYLIKSSLLQNVLVMTGLADQPSPH